MKQELVHKALHRCCRAWQALPAAPTREAASIARHARLCEACCGPLPHTLLPHHCSSHLLVYAADARKLRPRLPTKEDGFTKARGQWRRRQRDSGGTPSTRTRPATTTTLLNPHSSHKTTSGPGIYQGGISNIGHQQLHMDDAETHLDPSAAALHNQTSPTERLLPPPLPRACPTVPAHPPSAAAACETFHLHKAQALRILHM